jgi:hypothetical protein
MTTALLVVAVISLVMIGFWLSGRPEDREREERRRRLRETREKAVRQREVRATRGARR